MTTEEKIKLAQRMLERHQQQEAIEERERVPRLMAAQMHQEAERAPRELWPGQAIIDLTMEIETLYADRERLQAENARLRFLLSPPVEK